MGDVFYRSKDPTNSIKVLKENLQRKTTPKTQRKHLAEDLAAGCYSAGSYFQWMFSGFLGS